MFYAGHDEFMLGALGFIGNAVAAGDPILVVVDRSKIDALRQELSAHASRVEFANMEDMGVNPARIISMWRDFVNERAGRARQVRGIGEPISDRRRGAELIECHRHEALLNAAFSDANFWLLCPYDTLALEPAVLASARRTHPFVCDHGTPAASSAYPGTEVLVSEFDDPLPAPPGDATVLAFGPDDGPRVRGFVSRYARNTELRADQAADLVLAANEMATNSVRHGGGAGTIRMWKESDAIMCEVQDGGWIRDPLVGRIRPGPESGSGRGLWLANHLCDLVQVRSSPAGTTVRAMVRSDSR